MTPQRISNPRDRPENGCHSTGKGECKTNLSRPIPPRGIFSAPRPPPQLKVRGLSHSGWPTGLFATSKEGRVLGIFRAPGKAVGPKASLLNHGHTQFPHQQNALITPAQPTSWAGLEDQIKPIWKPLKSTKHHIHSHGLTPFIKRQPVYNHSVLCANQALRYCEIIRAQFDTWLNSFIF